MRPEDISTLYMNAGVQTSYAETVVAFSMMAKARFDSLCSRYEAETGERIPRAQVIMTIRKVFEEVLIVAPKAAAKFGKSYAMLFWDFQRKFHQLRTQIQNLAQITERIASVHANLLAA